MTGYIKVSLSMLIEEIGEDNAKQLLSDFSCPLNNDIERFLRFKAIEFEKQQLSRTQLIFASYCEKIVLVAYYTLSQKSFNITKAALSATLRKKITKYSTYDYVLKSYILPAPLIAQGDELLKIACDDVQLVQSIVGGKIAYLECEDCPRLLDFYTSNGFVEFDKRPLDPNETAIKGEYLVQMLKVFKRK